MKKIHIYIGLIIISLTSCSEFLTFDNPNEVTDADWWNSEQDARSALSTIYTYVPKGTESRMNFGYGSDEIYSIKNAEYAAWVNGNLTAANGKVQGLWESGYKYIRRANRFFKNVGNCSMNEELRARYIAEAKVLRAWMYLDLVVYFGDVPLVLEELIPTHDAVRARTDKAEVLNFVVSELEAAIEVLPVEHVFAENWRMSKGAALTLKAQVHMLRKEWDLAAATAKTVCESGVYKLYRNETNPELSYRQLFIQDGELNTERIIIKKDGCKPGFSAAPPSLGGDSRLAPLANTIDVYETLDGRTLSEMDPTEAQDYISNPGFNRDPRLVASVILPGATFNKKLIDPFDDSPDNKNRIGAPDSSPTGFWLKKYVDGREQEPKSNRTLDYMVIRLPDVMLMYAEAKVELGEFHDADAIRYMNDIRDRAGMPAVDLTKYDTQEKMRQLVRRERHVELAFEGRRFFDIRRWELGDLLTVPARGATNSFTGETVIVESRNFVSPTHYLFPIPQNEMIRNALMTQNEGY